MKKIPSHKKIKVIVALSGGVDSAVAAAILEKQGHEVVGVFFRLFGSIQPSEFQAKKVASKLRIPLEIVDARKVFKKIVMDYFADSYKKGLTPNPCVVCNKEIKFRLLFDLMRKMKADYVSTGHYARLGRETPNPKSKIPNKSRLQVINYKLLEALDKKKDQSYFLYGLAQKDLAKIIFPLGNHRKSEVKKMAKKLGLPVAENESQDICFLEGKDIGSYFKKIVSSKRGDIVDEAGNILGKHEGLPFYTIGQRKGIKIGGSGPYFVVRKNLRKNELIVSRNGKDLLTKEFKVRHANWVISRKKFPLRSLVQIRYRADKFPAIIKKATSGIFEVKTAKSLRAVTEGQSAVFYKGEKMLGGGIIM